MPKPEVVIRDKTFIVKITSNAIQSRISGLANEIETDYINKNPIIIGVLTGAAIFTCDVFRRLSMDCELTFIRVSSYSGTESTGKVTGVIGLKENIKNRHVLIFEDIVDSGETAVHLLKELQGHQPASLKLATALFKPAALKHRVEPDYVGFEVEPDFLVGYGLDYDGLGRNLNDIYVLKS